MPIQLKVKQIERDLEEASGTLWGWDGVIFHKEAIILNFRACKGKGLSSWCLPTPSALSYSAVSMV